MAIEQLGESLLSNVRSYNERIASENRKRQRQAQMLGLGLKAAQSIGNQLLADSAEEFFKNEEIYNATAQQQSALQKVKTINNVYNQIESENITVEDYFYNQYKDAFKAQYSERMNIEADKLPSAYTTIIDNQAREMAKKRAIDFNEAKALADKVGTADQWRENLKLSANKAIPKNLFEAGTKAVANFFTGRTNEEIEEEALLAITEGKLAKNAEALNTFWKAYSKTRDLNSAFDFTTLVHDDVSEDDFMKQRKEGVEIVTSDGVAYVLETVEVEDEFGNTEKTYKVGSDGKPTAKPVFTPDSSDDDVELDSLNTLNGIFNYGTDAKSQLTNVAFSAFAKEALDKGINIQSPKTVKEYNDLSDLYSTYLLDEKNIQNKFRQDQVLEIQKLVYGAGLNAQTLIANLQADPTKRQEMLDKLLNQLLQLSTTVEDFYGQTSGIKQ